MTTSSASPAPNQDADLLKLGIANLQAAAVARAAQLQAAWAAAGRQAEQAAITARERSDQTQAALQRLSQLALTTPPTLRPVNQELKTDWKLLDGISVRREVMVNAKVRRNMVTRLAYVPTPEGNAFVQLRVDADVQARQGFGWTTVAKEVADGRYDLATGVTLLSSSRESERPDVAPMYEAMALIGEYGWLAKMQGVAEGKVPLGAIPSPALNEVVGAIPGQLPDSIYLWVVDWESGQVMPADFRLRERITENVPVAARGQSCGDPAVRVERAARRVVRYRVKMGVKEEERRFLADPPHVAVSDDVKCIDVER